jgi:predicted glutamine amidotransferase
MCGIAGCRAFKDDPITKHHIQSLLLAIEFRGAHATGVAFSKDGEISVLKDDEPAWKFLKDSGNDKWIDSQLEKKPEIVLLHTRHATQGSPRKNENNHPMFSGLSAVCHNGMISNDDHMFDSLKLERKAETDSDIFRAIIDEEGLTPKAIRTMNRLSGSAAISAVHPKYPGKFLLARSGNPIVFCTTETGLMMWASVKEALHHAQRLWTERFGMWVRQNRTDLMWATMPDNSAYIFGPEGKEWHDEFKIAYSYTSPRYAVYDNYYEKNKRWDAELSLKQEKKVTQEKGDRSPTFARCVKCGWFGDIPKKLRHLELHELVCGNKQCKTPLAEEPIEGKMIVTYGTETDNRPAFD